MEFIKKTRRFGNSAGVLLPKSLLGSEVKVTLIKRPLNLKKEVLKAVEQYLDDIQGIYLINKEPLEILAISNKQAKIINENNIKISIVPLSLIKKDIKTKQVLRKKIFQSKTILNKKLIYEVKKNIRNSLAKKNKVITLL